MPSPKFNQLLTSSNGKNIAIRRRNTSYYELERRPYIIDENRGIKQTAHPDLSERLRQRIMRERAQSRKVYFTIAVIILAITVRVYFLFLA